MAQVGREGKVALDLVPQIRGDRRYRVACVETMEYEPVGPGQDVLAYPVHGTTCPAARPRSG